ncbi:hypothetical protein WK13_34560 [Burkholderia ubonensis]|uniref:hypothetical protein n=1 Tax=Burkholderia ubonensis TaxID=101571 RepID=UPI0007562214|nr:hypothetical protein [Burkholderia ubonensis]KVR21662.1 hypothetical protein WK13_34560 [Burkholderia ubonensis]
MKNGMRKTIQIKGGGIAQIVLFEDRQSYPWYHVRTYAPGIKTPLPEGGELPYMTKRFWRKKSAVRYFEERVLAWTHVPEVVRIEDDLVAVSKVLANWLFSRMVRWSRLGA